MNKKKWQCLTAALMISLMSTSAFGAATRNVPMPSPSPSATSAPAPKAVAPSTTPATPKAVTPSTTPATPKVVSPSATSMPAPKAVTPSTTPAAPKAVTPSTTPAAPKAATPSATPATPKAVTPSTTPASPKTGAPHKQGQKEKPFILDNFKVIAKALDNLGVNEAKLTAYIKDGKKLEDVLKAEKISTRKFKKCVIKEYNRVVDEAVKANQLTCEQGKQLKGAIKETIKNWLPRK